MVFVIRSMVRTYLIIIIFIILSCGNKNEPRIREQETKFDSLYHILIGSHDSLVKDHQIKFKKELSNLGYDSTCVEVYRFGWDRSFHPPITFTISRSKEVYKLLIKEFNDTICVTIKTLSKNQWISFKKEIEGAYFWSLLPAHDDPYAIGSDGSNWVLEGKRKTISRLERKYNIVFRHSPPNGSFRNACIKLIEFSGLVPKEEIY